MNLTKPCPFTSLVFWFCQATITFLVVSCCCRCGYLPNDLLQKIQKTLTNTHITKQKGTNKSVCNTKKHPHF